MTQGSSVGRRREIESLDPSIRSIQPGGGICMALELGWGYLRRWYLRSFRRGYIESMRRLRKRQPEGCPHEVLDPRDLKYYRNITGDVWSPEDDPFRWRNRIPFARDGLGELVLLSGASLVAALAGLFVFWPVSIACLIWAVFVCWFFRDPDRSVPADHAVIVAPADGKVVALDEVTYEPYIDGPAIVVGIFLSVFNVHVNRSPYDVRVIGLSYTPGKFLNAMRPISARENEQLAIRLEANEPPFRGIVVRQIAGAIARRIVCRARPGDQLARGMRFGMIKFGSRTELVLPREESLLIEVSVGDKVKGGSSVVARYL